MSKKRFKKRYEIEEIGFYDYIDKVKKELKNLLIYMIIISAVYIFFMVINIGNINIASFVAVVTCIAGRGVIWADTISDWYKKYSDNINENEAFKIKELYQKLYDISMVVLFLPFLMLILVWIPLSNYLGDNWEIIMYGVLLVFYLFNSFLAYYRQKKAINKFLETENII